MRTMANRRLFRVLVGAAIVLCASACTSERLIEPAAAQTDLSLMFDDPGTTGDWQDRWFKDGRGAVRYTADGMVYDATTGETVLWAKPVVRGDVRIEYDYTHLDDSPKPYVVIIFIQAKGAATHPADLSTWQRPVASYSIYHDEMDNYSITYDNAGGNVRARHNAGFEGLEKYHYMNMFERNKTYHITIEKSGRNFSMTAENVLSGESRTFSFTGNALPVIDQGRIGLRQMDDRISRYKNFKIWATQYVGGGGGLTDPGTTGETTGGATRETTRKSAGQTASTGCLSTFTGPITRLDQDYGYTGFKAMTWHNQARFDARGGRWTSQMNGYDDFYGVVPIQFGADWGTNKIDRNGQPDGRRDLYSRQYNTAPQPDPFCFFGGTIIGTQPLDATWGEIKRPGGGYAITVNGRGAVVEGVRIHNHHDAFLPYRSDGFVFRGNWVSYVRDDCIENDAHAAGTIEDNLFDGCYSFYSGYNGVKHGPVGAGANGTVRLEGNLVKMQNMPGPYNRKRPLGDRARMGYGDLFKTRDRDARVPQFVMRSNTFAFERPIAKGNMDFVRPNLRIVECANNTILWFDSGPFPGEIPSDLRSCFSILTGGHARQRWTELRQQWIDAHPNIARISAASDADLRRSSHAEAGNRDPG